MERIKQALEKARLERHLRQQGDPVTPVPQTPDTTRREHNAPAQPIDIDISILRENRIITGLETGPFTESYNLLRTQVLQRAEENNWKVLAITSPGPGEGKTLTAINLAISIAKELDYTVLLVDANLRNPWMLEHFGISHRKGLSDYLTGDTPMAELLLQPKKVPKLVVLPGGHPLGNSAEMLNSPKMMQLVEEMKSSYHSRIIIIDLPPILTSSDVLAFSPYVDAALLVVEEGATRKQDVEHALGLLQNINIIGTVLNKAEASK